MILLKTWTTCRVVWEVLGYSWMADKKLCAIATFLFTFISYWRAIFEYKHLGVYIRRGYLTEGFLRYEFGGGVYLEGLIFRILRL